MPIRLIKRYSDLALAGLVVLIIALMIIPMPTWLLDILLATNISMAVVLLLSAIYVTRPLRIATFPTILLITTLFRLGLNVSSTRLILLQADAGEVIRSFGHFVVAGNVVVGAIVFLILTLIQFVVIAKGSERVAEVAARFTLDAMPGKQMSIDADLRAGNIDADEARRRRKVLERESQLYGSMDGAMKFVKGDAIAGIAITLINIVGGLIVGVYQMNMSAGEAAQTYSLLTIGDGLVSQIPALVISTAAGLVVTRVASEDENAHLGQDIGLQLLGQPKAIAIAGMLMLLMAVVPGLPAFPFLVLGSVCCITAYGLLRRRRSAEPGGTSDGLPGLLESLGFEAPDELPEQRDVAPLVEPIAVEVSPELSDLVDSHGQGRAFADELLPAIRARIFHRLGVSLPPIQVRGDAPGAPGGGYRILLKEVAMGEGTLESGQALALAPVAYLRGLGVEARVAELSGLEHGCAWVGGEEGEGLRGAGVEVHEGPAVIARHTEALLERYAHEFVSIQQTRTLLDQLEATQPQLVEELVPKPVRVDLLAEILRRLAEEGINIRHLEDILPALAAWQRTEKDPVLLTEYCRMALKRQITYQFCGSSGALSAIVVDPEVEQVVTEAIQRTEAGSYLALEPELSREILSAARVAVEPALEAGEPAVLLASMETRRFVRKLLEVELPSVTVLSYQELAPDLEIRPVARLELGASSESEP